MTFGEKLKQARRALDSLSQVTIMDEWQFDNELSVWYLHVSIMIECETPYFPQKSQWYFIVESEYPKGKIKSISRCGEQHNGYFISSS